jgi:hypothetical protein
MVVLDEENVTLVLVGQRLFDQLKYFYSWYFYHYWQKYLLYHHRSKQIKVLAQESHQASYLLPKVSIL